jgi:LAO/AO transport system kinase
VLEEGGELEARRREQARAWLWALVDERLGRAFRSHPAVARRLPALEADVQARKSTPSAAARELLAAFLEGAPDAEDPGRG